MFKDGKGIVHRQWKFDFWALSVVAVDHNAASDHSDACGNFDSMLSLALDTATTTEVDKCLATRRR